MSDRWATFDCYGTLIDWDGGIRRALARCGRTSMPNGCSTATTTGSIACSRPRHPVPPGPARDAGVDRREAEELEVPPGDDDALAESLPSWRPFPEVTASLADLRDRGWRIGILSNSDPDLLAASLKTIGVPVDVRVTAQEAHAYKPAFAHWDTFFRQTTADRERHVHVAASLYHDVEPCAQLGLPCVWINRLDESSDLPRAGELSNLAGLPATLDVLVPG